MIARRLPSRRTARRALVGLLALSVAAGGTAFAASLSVTSGKLTGWQSSAGCTPGTVTVAADADSYVDQDNSSSNFGTSASLRVGSELLSVLGALLAGERWTLVRFSLPSAGLCTVGSAKLRLNASSASSSRTLQALRVTGSWTEGAVTWTIRPATTSVDAASTTSGTGYREWTVTSQLTSMYAGTNNGFLVKDATGTSLLSTHEQVFSSREAASNNPQLVITFS